VVFAKTRVTIRFRAKTRDIAQGYLRCVPPHIGDPVVRTDERTDGQTDGHVTIMSLPKFAWLDRVPNLLSNGALLKKEWGA